MLPEDVDADAVQKALSTGMDGLSTSAQRLLIDAPSTAMLMLIVDQFEGDVHPRAGSAARSFIGLLEHAATVPNGRCIVVLTMRADFFDRLGRYPDFAEAVRGRSALDRHRDDAVQPAAGDHRPGRSGQPDL
ncbi:MAG: hypothetical protein HND48_22155 [Chloroflexi bacterium]|nr:hypothetical protein [Chloroflexota bacterium]